MRSCPFCLIVRRDAPASVVAENDRLIAFMTLRPTRPGECLVIPKDHIDHFTDIPDPTVADLMVMAQAIGRTIRREFSCQRVGMIVHGFGVAHAHLILLPQHGAHDIVSGEHLEIRDGTVFFDRRPPAVDRAVLDEHARRLAKGLAT